MDEPRKTEVSIHIHLNESPRFHCQHEDKRFVSIDLGGGNYLCAKKELYASLIGVCAEAIRQIDEGTKKERKEQ